MPTFILSGNDDCAVRTFAGHYTLVVSTALFFFQQFSFLFSSRTSLQACVQRNFGQKELREILELKEWSCYACEPTTKMRALQIQAMEAPLFNIQSTYLSIHPPSTNIATRAKLITLIAALSFEEKVLANIFIPGVLNSGIGQLRIAQNFLVAADVFSFVYSLSRNLRELFKATPFFLPGLFRTKEDLARRSFLYNHQLVSLQQMLEMEQQGEPQQGEQEGRQQEGPQFGMLRGGILADEPGLGKTVTAMALIASSAGTLPQQPFSSLEQQAVEAEWPRLKGQYLSTVVQPIVATLTKSPFLSPFEHPDFANIRANAESLCATPHSLFQACMYQTFLITTQHILLLLFFFFFFYYYSSNLYLVLLSIYMWMLILLLQCFLCVVLVLHDSEICHSQCGGDFICQVSFAASPAAGDEQDAAASLQVPAALHSGCSSTSRTVSLPIQRHFDHCTGGSVGALVRAGEAALEPALLRRRSGGRKWGAGRGFHRRSWRYSRYPESIEQVQQPGKDRERGGAE